MVTSPKYEINSSSIASPYIHDTSRKISGIFETAIQNALLEETYADKKRIDYLTSLNKALQGVINDLSYDLGKTA